MTEFKFVDPTTCGLFLVAVVSLPLCILQLLGEGAPSAAFLKLMGIAVLAVALLAWIYGNNFGFTVFAVAGAGVAMVGFGMGGYEHIAFSLMCFLAIVWSIIVKNPNSLTVICFTTGLVFLACGLSIVVGGDYWHWIAGTAALLNFVFSVYLACALALNGKIKVW